MFYSYNANIEFPKALDKEIQLEYFKRLKNGEVELRDVLIMHNLRIVTDVISKKFNFLNLDKEDLLQVGTIGLINAVDNYDYTKEIGFYAFAYKCVYNAMLVFLKNKGEERNHLSLEGTAFHNEDGRDVMFIDILPDKKTNILGMIENREFKNRLSELVNSIAKPRNREIISKIFGFGYPVRTQIELASEYGISRAQIYNILRDFLKSVSRTLVSEGFIEIKDDRKHELGLDTVPSYYREDKIKRTKSGRKIKTIYDNFNYSHDKVNAVIDMLSEEEKTLIEARWGLDLENPVISVKGNDYQRIDYKIKKFILPKMNKILFELETNKTLKMN